MPYSFYKILHVLGIAMLLVAVGGVFVHAANAGDKNANVVRKTVLVLHGLGSFLILLAGFGLLARIGIVDGLPGWIWPKLAIWLVLSLIIALPYRSIPVAKALLWITPLLVLLSAYFAVYKPL